MQDLWRLSATDLAGLIKSKKVSAKEAATAALARLDAVNPKINAVVDHKPAEVLAEAAAVDAKIARGEDRGHAGRRACHGEGQYRPAGFCHHQRAEDPEGRDRAKTTARSSTIFANRAPSFSAAPIARPFPIAGSPPTSCMATPRTRATPASRRAARRAARARRSRPASAISRTAPISRARSAIPPMPAAFTACGRRSAASPRSTPRCRSAPSARRSRRSPVRSRAPSPISASRLRRCRALTRAIPGGCRRRSKVRRSRNSPRCASIPTASIPCRK